jgi:hypothetical protein
MIAFILGRPLLQQLQLALYLLCMIHWLRSTVLDMIWAALYRASADLDCLRRTNRCARRPCDAAVLPFPVSHAAAPLCVLASWSGWCICRCLLVHNSSRLVSAGLFFRCVAAMVSGGTAMQAGNRIWSPLLSSHDWCQCCATARLIGLLPSPEQDTSTLICTAAGLVASVLVTILLHHL